MNENTVDSHPLIYPLCSAFTLPPEDSGLYDQLSMLEILVFQVVEAVKFLEWASKRNGYLNFGEHRVVIAIYTKGHSSKILATKAPLPT